MFRSTLVIVFVALLPAVADAAPCAQRDDFLDYFLAKYDESPVSLGLTSDGRVLEILASDKGTWTIIVTVPSGQTCGLATGEAWSSAPKPDIQPGDTAS